MSAAPLHTGMIAGHPLCFFGKPTGKPELPWHAVDDLYKALGLNREVRRELHRKTQSWSSELRTIATTDGVVTIAPDYVAQGLIGAAVDTGRAPASTEAEYALAGVAATVADDLPPTASFDFVLNAFPNSGGGE